MKLARETSLQILKEIFGSLCRIHFQTNSNLVPNLGEWIFSRSPITDFLSFPIASRPGHLDFVDSLISERRGCRIENILCDRTVRVLPEFVLKLF